METLALLAFLFLAFELTQVVVLERYIGIRTLRQDLDPRDLPVPSWAALTWIVLTKLYLIWMVLLAFEPSLLLPALVMIGVTLAGLIARRSYGLRGALVILTFETALRVGMLLVILRWVLRA